MKGKAMSKQTREFLEQVKAGEEPRGFLQAIKEGIQAVAPGLSFSNILHDIGAEVKQQAAHGAHELAAALFNGNGFVMYPRQSSHDDTQQGLPQEPQQPERERGGREM
jgi:hypothetical protein